jgi:hypothetical protein
LYALYNGIFGVILLIGSDSIDTSNISGDGANAMLGFGTAIAAILMFVTGLIMCAIAIIFIICGVTGLITAYKKSQKGALVNDVFKAIFSGICLFSESSSIVSEIEKGTEYFRTEWQTFICVFVLAAILIFSIKEIVNYIASKRMKPDEMYIEQKG